MSYDVDSIDLKDTRISFVMELIRKGTGIIKIVGTRGIYDIESIKPSIMKLCKDNNLGPKDTKYVMQVISEAPVRLAGSLSNSRNMDDDSELQIAEVYSSFASPNAVAAISKYFESNGIKTKITKGGNQLSGTEIDFLWGSIKNRN